MPYKNIVLRKEKQRKYDKKWRLNNPDKVRSARKTWIENNPEKYRAIQRRWWWKHREERLAKDKIRAKELNKKWRWEVLSHYSGGTPNCNCCGEKHIEFLAVNHINGNGRQHRNSIGMKGGSQFFNWLRRNHYPSGFQILCMNCNWGKRLSGRCPHQITELERVK